MAKRRQKERERELESEIILREQDVLTPKACARSWKCLGAHCYQDIWACICLYANRVFYPPSVPLFPGRRGTSLSPQLWGNLGGSQRAWQCQSPRMSWQLRRWAPVQRTPVCAAWRRHRSQGHFSVQKRASHKLSHRTDKREQYCLRKSGSLSKTGVMVNTEIYL